MPLPDDSRCGDDTALRVELLLIALGLSTLEFFIPRIPVFPWLKPGLANAVTLVWVMRYGFTDAVLFVVMRTWVLSFYFGFSFITTALGLMGGITAVGVTALLCRLQSRVPLFGLVGISIGAAFAHNAGQLGGVYLFLIRSTRLWGQIPVMAAASVLSGSVTGLLAKGVGQLPSPRTGELPFPQRSKTPNPGGGYRLGASLGVVAVCVLVTFVRSWVLLAWGALGMTVVVQIVWRGSLSRLVLPLRRFWLFFLVVAVLHVWYGTGEAIAPALVWLPREGAMDALRAWLRLWLWLQSTSLFLFMNFHLSIHAALARYFPSHGATLYAALMVLERYPALVERFRASFFSLAGVVLRSPRRFVPRLHLLIREVLADAAVAEK